MSAVLWIESTAGAEFVVTLRAGRTAPTGAGRGRKTRSY